MQEALVHMSSHSHTFIHSSPRLSSHFDHEINVLLLAHTSLEDLRVAELRGIRGDRTHAAEVVVLQAAVKQGNRIDKS